MSLEKRPDIVAKAGRSNIVGEAKFLTDNGGHQVNQFKDALRLLEDIRGRAVGIAILDGVLWIKGKTQMHVGVSKLERDALTALLFKEYLEHRVTV